jgi:hypothetical protein
MMNLFSRFNERGPGAPGQCLSPSLFLSLSARAPTQHASTTRPLSMPLSHAMRLRTAWCPGRHPTSPRILAHRKRLSLTEG